MLKASRPFENNPSYLVLLSNVLISSTLPTNKKGNGFPRRAFRSTEVRRRGTTAVVPYPGGKAVETLEL